MQPQATQPRESIRLSDLQAERRGFGCPQCGCRMWRVSRTQQREGSIYRERRCRHCGFLLQTDEQPR